LNENERMCMLLVCIMGANSVEYEVRAEAEERVDGLYIAIEVDCV